ncbi:MAG TPA: gamma carbonic anhydrase family protein [Anaerolineae bacterium]|nr:gamma carbonic anhydrase family protein [Anaerolineae bacterium]
MAIYEFEGRKPILGKGTYVHPSADVIGAVTVGDGCWIGPGARLRGDYGSIIIGNGTSIEENCVIHARPDQATHIGNHVTVGHGSVLHNCTIHDYAVIGMGSVVSDWAEVGEWSVVGEGAVVRQRQQVPPGQIAVGVPAKLLDKSVGEEYKAEWLAFKRTYQDLARRYPQGLVEVGDD